MTAEEINPRDLRTTFSTYPTGIALYRVTDHHHQHDAQPLLFHKSTISPLKA